MAERKISDLRDRWNALRHERALLEADKSTKGLPHDHPRVPAHQAAVASSIVRTDAVADSAWALPARDLADLLLLAEIAYEVFWDIRLFPEVPPDVEPAGDRQAIAVVYLIRGVVHVAHAPPSVGG